VFDGSLQDHTRGEPAFGSRGENPGSVDEGTGVIDVDETAGDLTGDDEDVTKVAFMDPVPVLGRVKAVTCCVRT
jgi:hypothetical protein